MIRKESDDDKKEVYRINTEAFETDAEAKIVDRLRIESKEFISLVAVENDGIVGHIMFTPVTLSGNSDLRIIGLAPMAVKPEFQKMGIGTNLVKHGLKECREAGYGACVVLGHPEYYPKFGFVPSVKFDIKSEYDVPDEVFMVLEIVDDFLYGKSGTIKYHQAFSQI